MLNLDNLSVWFGGGRDRVDAVRNASFCVNSGASFGIVGESGSGKSTILRAVMGLIPNWSGAISVDGRPVDKKREKSFYKIAQMVFQDPYASLHPRHSVDQVLGETLYLHGFSDIDHRVVKLLDDVGLGAKFRFRYPHQLSGGQRQRVAIARAIVADPGLIVGDEPTGDLDRDSGDSILDLLRELSGTHGKTIVMVTHDARAAEAAERTLRLDNGQLIEIDQLSAKPKTAAASS